ncbi:ScyD/ScyE family protein [Hamadaea sp.]|uniref:ScyD/ScyE family protein n=1 Tax=Hamadaea sp. TaxID=2024425 RepID=UPI0025BF8F93|nr:ScyD/ScyE family protein [Hamadaea sp.]
MRVLIASAVALAAAFAPTPALAAPTTVVVQGLNNPRGLAFGPDGALYVAEAGKGGAGPCFPGPEGGEACFGTSGALARVKNGALTRVITGLPSVADPDGSGAIGPSDVSFLGIGFLTIGLGANPALRGQLPPAGKKLGTLNTFVPGPVTPAPTFKRVADVSAYEAAHNPDGGEVDSNPESVVPGPGGLAVSDAGGNSLLGVSANGAIKTLAVFPDRDGFQAVPTGVAYYQGAYYVGQLTGFPFPKGAARIYKVVPGHQPQIVATGLTNLIDVAVTSNGTIYALEIAHEGLLNPAPSGRLLKIRPGQSPVTVVGGLILPGGFALHDGYAYISNCGVCAGGGQIVRVPL